MEIFKTEIIEPQHLLNVLVNYTVEDQDFWTRGYLYDKTWRIMTWDGTKSVPKNEIKEWCKLPNQIK